MDIDFDVKNQMVSRKDANKVVNWSDDYLRLCFNFQSSDWEDCNKFILIFTDINVYRIALVDDMFIVPEELLTSNKLIFSIYGVTANYRITTPKILLHLLISGYDENTSDLDANEFTNDVVEAIYIELDKKVNTTDLTALLNQLENRLNNHIQVEATPQIFQTTDTSVIKVYCVKNGVPIYNSQVEFIINGGLYDSDYTNAQGIATVEYTGIGAGKLGVTAICDSLESETYEVTDCSFMDYKSDNTKNTNWVANSQANVTTNDATGETTITATATATYRSKTLLTGDFEAILEAKTDRYVRVGFTDNVSKFRRVGIGTPEYNYIKFKRLNGVWTVQSSANGETWTEFESFDSSTLTNEDCYFIFNIILPSGDSYARSVTFKNLRIYPI